MTLEAERSQSCTNLSRKQMTAIQVKDLRKTMSEDKLALLLKKRYDQGMWYKDEDWPDDEEERLTIITFFELP